jgi:autophagy-related protein 9
MKVMIFVQELLSVILTPFVLWYTLPKCAPDIVDFFRDFTVHVEGLGYVCSFAVFNFERHGNVIVSFSSKVLSEDPFLFSLARQTRFRMSACSPKKGKWRKAS